MSGTLINHAQSALNPPKKPYKVAIKEYPVTLERLPYVPSENDPLVDPGTARANYAPTEEKPDGTTEGNWAKNHQHQTVSPRPPVLPAQHSFPVTLQERGRTAQR